MTDIMFKGRTLYTINRLKHISTLWDMLYNIWQIGKLCFTVPAFIALLVVSIVVTAIALLLVLLQEGLKWISEAITGKWQERRRISRLMSWEADEEFRKEAMSQGLLFDDYEYKAEKYYSLDRHSLASTDPQKLFQLFQLARKYFEAGAREPYCILEPLWIKREDLELSKIPLWLPYYPHLHGERQGGVYLKEWLVEQGFDPSKLKRPKD